MITPDGTLLVLAAILFFGLVVPEFFKKFQMPFVTSLILVGGLLGPHGINYIQSNESIELLGFLGSAFLMLLAGLQVKKLHLEKFREEVIPVTMVNSIVPFVAGVAVMRAFGYSWNQALLIGIIFISSSIALVSSTLKALNLHYSKIGKLTFTSVALMDILSLLLLTILLEHVRPKTIFPSLIYVGIVFSSIILLKMFLPEISTFYFKKHKKDGEYELQLRFVLVLLLISLLFFSWLGVPPIVAAFLVGWVLADVITSKPLYRKIHTFGYGLFVPVFFFIVGMQLDLSLLLQVKSHLIVVLIATLVASKVLSGFLIVKKLGHSNANSLIFGTSSASKLTTTLSASFAALSYNLLDDALITSIILLSIITTVLMPTVLTFMVDFWRRKHA